MVFTGRISCQSTYSFGRNSYRSSLERKIRVNYSTENEIIELFIEVVKINDPSGLNTTGPVGAPAGSGLVTKYPPGGLLGTSMNCLYGTYRVMN